MILGSSDLKAKDLTCVRIQQTSQKGVLKIPDRCHVPKRIHRASQGHLRKIANIGNQTLRKENIINIKLMRIPLHWTSVSYGQQFIHFFDFHLSQFHNDWSVHLSPRLHWRSGISSPNSDSPE